MLNALVKVGDTHHGDLIPGTVVVVEGDDGMNHAAPGTFVYFQNPRGGASFGYFICFLDDEQTELVRRICND